jgi:hypothetical protein
MRVEFQYADDPDLYGESTLDYAWTSAIEGIESGERATVVVPPGRALSWRNEWSGGARVVIDDQEFAWSAWQPLQIDRENPGGEEHLAPGIRWVDVDPDRTSGETIIAVSATPTLKTVKGVNTPFLVVSWGDVSAPLSEPVAGIGHARDSWRCVSSM